MSQPLKAPLPGLEIQAKWYCFSKNEQQVKPNMISETKTGATNKGHENILNAILPV